MLVTHVYRRRNKTDQLARALGLPNAFLSTGKGGGVIQASASETTLISMLAARTKALNHLRRRSPESTDHELFAKMTFYTSDQVRIGVPHARSPSGNMQFTLAADTLHAKGRCS